MGRAFVVVLLLSLTQTSHGSVVITLVPQEPGPYTVNSTVRVDVFAQLTPGTPGVQPSGAQNKIRVRTFTLDLSDSSPALTITPALNHFDADPDDDGVPNPIPFWKLSNTNCVANPGSCGANYYIDGDLKTITPNILNLTWTGLTSIASGMITLNQTAPKLVGSLDVTLTNPNVHDLDVLNADEPSLSFGAEIRHGFGVPADPTDPASPLRASDSEVVCGSLTFALYDVVDCNTNTVPDECDLSTGASFDCNDNSIPDECENPPVFTITMTDPPNGTVDVRQDRSITGQTAQGLDRVRMRFTCEPHDANTGQPLSTGSFSVSSTSGLAPFVSNIIQEAQPHTYQVVLSHPIPVGAWTTITANVASPDGVPIDPGASSVTLGFLPGDVNGNRQSMPSDILELIDHLNLVRVPPLPIPRCDIDRSGSCIPADIIRLIDLLNGVSTSRPWLGVSLPPMP